MRSFRLTTQGNDGKACGRLSGRQLGRCEMSEAENCGSKASLCFPSSGLPHSRGHGRRLTAGWHSELVLTRWCQCGVQHRQLPQAPFWPASWSHRGYHTALLALQARPRGLCSATGVISAVLAGWLAPWGQNVVVLGTFNTLSAAAVSI